MDEAFTATGDSGSLTVTPTTVTVRTATRERVIPMQQVASVTLQHPGLSTGYLHLVLFGDPRPDRVLAEWVEDGEAVIFRAAQYTAFSNAKDLIERYRAALPPEPPAATSPFPGFTPPAPNPQWSLPSQPQPAPAAPWDLPTQAPAPPPPGPSAAAGTSDSEAVPTLPPGLPHAEALREFLQEHPEALQEFLRNPQQFMREHPDVVQEFIRLRQQERTAAASGDAAAGSGAGRTAFTADAPSRQKRRSRFPGCLAVILVVVGLAIASGEGSKAVSYVKSFLTPTAVAAPSRFGAADADWSRTHAPDPSQPAGSAYQRQPDGSDKYTATTHVDGHVVGYTLHFASGGVSQSSALTGAVSELPSDAKRVSNTSAGRCVVYQYQSATLASALAGSSSAGSGGRIDVILSSGTGGTRFDPLHVVSAVLALGRAGDQSAVTCP